MTYDLRFRKTKDITCNDNNDIRRLVRNGLMGSWVHGFMGSGCGYSMTAHLISVACCVPCVLAYHTSLVATYTDRRVFFNFPNFLHFLHDPSTCTCLFVFAIAMDLSLFPDFPISRSPDLPTSAI